MYNIDDNIDNMNNKKNLREIKIPLPICIWCKKAIHLNQEWEYGTNKIVLHKKCKIEIDNIIKSGKINFYSNFLDFAERCLFKGCSNPEYCIYECSQMNNLCHHKRINKCKICNEENCELYKNK